MTVMHAPLPVLPVLPVLSVLSVRGRAAGRLGGGPSRRSAESFPEAVRMTVAHAPNSGRGPAAGRPARTEVRP